MTECRWVARGMLGMQCSSTGLCSARKKRCKTFIKRKRWCVVHCSDDARVAGIAAEKAIHCVLFKGLSKPDEIGINTCLILQNTLDVTVTDVLNKTEHPTQVKGLVETVVHNYCDPTFTSYFRWRIIQFLPPRLCYDLYDLIIIGLLLLLITVVVLWCCNIYHYIIRGA